MLTTNILILSHHITDNHITHSSTPFTFAPIPKLLHIFTAFIYSLLTNYMHILCSSLPLHTFVIAVILSTSIFYSFECWEVHYFVPLFCLTWWVFTFEITVLYFLQFPLLPPPSMLPYLHRIISEYLFPLLPPASLKPEFTHHCALCSNSVRL